MDLPVELLKLPSLQALNISGNPLYSKFDLLLEKEASIAPELKFTLEKCFGMSSTAEEVFKILFRNPPGCKVNQAITLKRLLQKW